MMNLLIKTLILSFAENRRSIKMMKRLLYSKLGIHASAWIIYILAYAFVYAEHEESFAKGFAIVFIELPVKLIVTYTIIFLLFPKYLKRKKYAQFAFWSFIAMIIASMAHRFIVYNYVYPVYYTQYLDTDFIDIARIVKGFINLLGISAFIVALELGQVWFQDLQRNQELIREKLDAELKFLKNQIHPHFLFNTLNNLYSLVLKKSDDAEEVVLKISEIMRYMLYDSNTPTVNLSKEIKYIENYISLEKLRFNDRIDLSFNIYGDINSVQIPPMLLLPFVENSFKHSVSAEIEKAWLVLEVSVKENEIIFKAENSIKNTVQIAEGDIASGIGLQNVKRRLELLYAGKYDLIVENDKNTYLVILKLRND